MSSHIPSHIPSMGLRTAGSQDLHANSSVCIELPIICNVRLQLHDVINFLAMSFSMTGQEVHPKDVAVSGLDCRKASVGTG